MALIDELTAEDGGSSPFEFTAVVTATGNSISESTAQYYAGSHSYDFAFGGTDAECVGYYTLSDIGEIYVNFFWRRSSNFPGSGYAIFPIFGINSSGAYNGLVALQLVTGGDGNPSKWRINGNGITETDYTATISADAWHEIEVYWKYGSGSTTSVYATFNGTDLYRNTAINCSRTTADRVWLGLNPGYGTAIDTSHTYIDNIGIYDAEPSGASVVPLIMQSMNQFNGGLM
jgi:hypothetical protein